MYVIICSGDVIFSRMSFFFLNRKTRVYVSDPPCVSPVSFSDGKRDTSCYYGIQCLERENRNGVYTDLYNAT